MAEEVNIADVDKIKFRVEKDGSSLKFRWKPKDQGEHFSDFDKRVPLIDTVNPGTTVSYEIVNAFGDTLDISISGDDTFSDRLCDGGSLSRSLTDGQRIHLKATDPNSGKHHDPTFQVKTRSGG